MIPRTALAGGPPDGVIDSLMFWLPSVKANRKLWERGQALWTEQMTVALSGPCGDCNGAMSSPPPSPVPTYVQTPPEPAAPLPSTAYLPCEPQESATAAHPSGRVPAAEEPGDGLTSAVPAFADYNRPPEDPPTSAVPTFSSGASHTAPSERTAEPPASDADEHESHTVMLTALPNLRAAARLVVLEGPVRGRQFSLGRDRTTIGRSIGCHVTVEGDQVAYDHATVVRNGDGWAVELARNAFGLSVNDEPVQGSRALKPGDTIQIGPARLRFESVT